MPNYDVHAKQHFLMQNYFEKKTNIWNLTIDANLTTVAVRLRHPPIRL